MISKKIKAKLKDIIPANFDNLKWGKKQMTKLESVSGGYDTDKGYIRIFKDNYVLDGNHRYKLLLEKFGGDYEITVKQLPFTRKFHSRMVVTLFLLICILLLPISIIILYIIGRRRTKKQKND